MIGVAFAPRRFLDAAQVKAFGSPFEHLERAGEIIRPETHPVAVGLGRTVSLALRSTLVDGEAGRSRGDFGKSREITISGPASESTADFQCQPAAIHTRRWPCQPQRPFTQTAPGCGRDAQRPPTQTQLPRHSQQPPIQMNAGSGETGITSTCGGGGAGASTTTVVPGGGCCT